MSDWTEADAIKAARADPDSCGRQVYELSNKRIALSNELNKLRGWHGMNTAPLSGRDILLHIATGQTGGKDGHRTYMTIVGHWNQRYERWEGAGLQPTPAYWSEIPKAPDHALAQIESN